MERNEVNLPTGGADPETPERVVADSMSEAELLDDGSKQMKSDFGYELCGL